MSAEVRDKVRGGMRAVVVVEYHQTIYKGVDVDELEVWR